MRGNYLFTPLFEGAANGWPGVAGFDEVTPRGPQLRAPLGVSQQRDHGVGKLARLVGRRVVQPGLDAKALGADGCRDHRPRHRQRLENFQTRPAAGAQRHHVDRAFGN